jgi:hypothetical protein
MSITDRVKLQYVLGVSAAILLSPLLLLPLNPDNDTYQSMAFAMAEGKGLPYLGSWDQNFPGIVFYHWLSQALFGLSEIGFRLIDILNRIAIALLVFNIVQRLVSRKAAILSVLLVVLHYLQGGYWNAGQRDGFAVTWLLLALWFLMSESLTRKTVSFVGVSLALATFIRPTNAAFLVLLLVPVLAHRAIPKLVLYGLAGAVVTFTILVLPWVLQPGGLDAFITATLRFNADVYGLDREPLRQFLETLRSYKYQYIIGIVGLAAACYQERSTRPAWMLLAMYFVIGLGVILVMGKYHVYHFEIVSPMVLIGLTYAISRIANVVRRQWLVYSVTAILLMIGFYPASLIGQFINRGADAEAREQIYANFSSFPQFSREDELAVTKYLKQNTLPSSQVEILTLWPGLRWRSGYPGVTRFTTTYSLSMEGPKGLMPYQHSWRQELDSSLATIHPQVIIAATGPEYLFHYSKISPDSLLRSLPSMSHILNATYTLDTVIGGFRIYQRIK